jgi:hypothetical protein
MTREGHRAAAALLRVLYPPRRIGEFCGITLYVDPLMPDNEMRVVQDGKVVASTFLPTEKPDA